MSAKRTTHTVTVTHWCSCQNKLVCLWCYAPYTMYLWSIDTPQDIFCFCNQPKTCISNNNFMAVRVQVLNIAFIVIETGLCAVMKPHNNYFVVHEIIPAINDC